MVQPRPASTVVLVRFAGDDRFEVLLTRRPAQMKFLGGFYVFPGGTVHQDDYAPAVLQRCRDLSGTEARRMLGGAHDPDVALGHWTAVVRELFEEVGVLLCVTASGDPIDLGDETVRMRFEAKRQNMVKRAMSFGGFLESENLFCDLSRTVYFDHWVTPEVYSMRFDTRFYVAALPAHQTALECSEEVTHSLWIEPQAALLRLDRYEFPILPPTTIILNHLSQIGSWRGLRARYERR